MSTYRERREARAGRLDGWADKREERGAARLAATDAQYDAIPFGQPIMGAADARRRERLRESTGRAFDDLGKARDMRARAESIRAQADRAIYRDDPDAVVRLEAKLAELEGQRDRIKRYNASCKAAAKSGGVGDLSILSESERADIETLARVAAFQVGPGGAFPGYKLSNLGATIRKERARLEELSR